MQELVYQSTQSIRVLHAIESLKQDMFNTMVLALRNRPDMSHRTLTAILVEDCDVSREEADQFIRMYREV